jgi:TonB family protein
MYRILKNKRLLYITSVLSISLEALGCSASVRDGSTRIVIPKDPSMYTYIDGITFPLLRVYVVPEYPMIAREHDLDGDVVILARIDGKGFVTYTRVFSSSNPLFEPSALSAVKQFQFDPMRISPLRPTFGCLVLIPLKYSLSNSERLPN